MERDLWRWDGFAADALHLALLEDAQELRLHGRADIADLVEEDGAAVGELELAELALVGAGEGAALVAEQLGLDQGRDFQAIFLDAAGREVARMTRLVDAGYRYGMPVLGVTAVGKELTRDARYLGLATRICAELGAQLVKFTTTVSGGTDTENEIPARSI